jgi:hypothetical protein
MMALFRRVKPKAPSRTDIARVLFIAYMRHTGFFLTNEIPPPGTFPWVLADAVLDFLKAKR